MKRLRFVYHKNLHPLGYCHFVFAVAYMDNSYRSALYSGFICWIFVNNKIRLLGWKESGEEERFAETKIAESILSQKSNVFLLLIHNQYHCLS